MRLILKEDKEGFGRYLEVDLSKPLPNLLGFRIKEMVFTAEDRHWLGTHTEAKEWLWRMVMQRFTPRQ